MSLNNLYISVLLGFVAGNINAGWLSVWGFIIALLLIFVALFMVACVKDKIDSRDEEQVAKFLVQGAEIAKLQRGEYICRKCGLRKDSEFQRGDF